MKSSVPTKPALREPDAHVMMRHAKTVFRGLLILSLAGTIVALLFFRPGGLSSRDSHSDSIRCVPSCWPA